ncbi:MAG: peptidylprolyl isomerase [Longimicrobiales bacterium]
MMRQMRENTKIIMIFTALAFVGLMVFEWGMDASGRSSAQVTGGEVGRVNGDVVMYEDYIAVYQQLYQRQQQLQEEPLSGAQTRQLEDQAWEQIVSERLLQQELRRRGIRATEEEVRQAARYSPPPEFFSNELFQTDGNFDLAKYHQFLASPAADDQLLAQLEAYYRDAIPRTKLFRRVVAGTYATDDELWRMYRDRHERARIEYVMLDPATLVRDAEVSVTEDEIRQYYEQNRADLQRPARASLRVVALSKTPTRADTVAARERAVRLRQQLQEGEDFAELARVESSDAVSAERGGSLGTVERGQTDAVFDRAVFALPLGEVSEPVLTRYGYHLIEILDRTGDEAEVRHILIPIEREADSENLLLARADSLEDIGELRGLQNAARELRLPATQVTLSEGSPFIAVVGSVDEGESWAFAAESGQTSPVFENERAFYMFELLDRTPAGTLSLEETRDAIRQRLIVRKKLERARQMARDIVDRVNGGTGLPEAAAARGLEAANAGPFARVDFVPGLGSTNAAVGAAFGLRPGHISPPIEADERVYLVRLLELESADREAWEAQKDEQRREVIGALEQSRLAQFMGDLRSRADVVDNRARALAAAQQQPATALY